jgi:hypothetical protein
MKMKTCLGIAGLIAVTAACIPSVNPFYTEKDIVFDQRLVGEWQTGDTNSNIQTWKFEKSEDSAYKLVVTEKEGKTSSLDAHLFKLKDQLFLDIIANDLKFAPEQGDLVTASMIAGHLLLRVPKLDTQLQLAYCDYDWLGKYLDENPTALAHRRENKAGVLTATTKELQAFMLQHLDKLFQEPETLVRKTAK